MYELPSNAPALQTISRRSFLKNSAIGASISAMGMLGTTLAGFGKPTLRHSNPLKIPTLMAGRKVGAATVYDLNVEAGFTEFFGQVRTKTKGINGSYLGPTLKFANNDNVKINVKNSTGDTTTLHWHGLHLPAKMDGGPHQPIKNGTTWSPEFQIKQKAASFWYHSHLMHKTAEQVWQGLAGMIIVEDSESKNLGLPQEYGVDDFPVVLQDRRFDNDGQMHYSPSRPDIMMGMVGNIPLANGTVSAFVEANSKLIRLRLLNGSNASTYNLGFSDNRPFQQIGTDGGMLEKPYGTKNIVLLPGERAEIIVDVSGGQNIMLQSRSASSGESTGQGMGRGMMGQGMGMGRRMGGMMNNNSQPFNFLEIRPSANLKSSTTIPAKLADIDWLSPSDAVKTRQFVLEMTMGPMAMLGLGNTHTINNKAMEIGRIDEIVKRGDTEIWEIGNTSPLPHPFHIHDVQFQILDRNGNRPHPGEQGLKDTVVVYPGEVVRIIAKFSDYADPDLPYMYHCHILEHEDAGMMGQFTVV